MTQQFHSQRNEMSLKKNENKCPHKDLYTNINNTLFVTARNWLMDKQVGIWYNHGITIP